MARIKTMKRKLKMKFFAVREKLPASDEVTALAGEVILPTSGTRRAAVAFYSAPTSEDLRAAQAELERWGQFQLDVWEKQRTKHINEFIN